MKEEKLQPQPTTLFNSSGTMKEWGIIICFFVIAISVVMQFYLFVAVPDRLSILFGFSVSKVVNLTAIFGLFYAAGLLIWGRLASIYGSKKIMLVGLFLLSAASLALTLTTQYLWLVSLRALQGFVAAAFPSAVILWLTDNISPPRRVVAIAYTSCGFLLSASLGQWFGTALISSSLLPVMGMATLVYVCGGILLISLPSVTSEQQQQANSFFSDLGQIVRQRDLTKVYILTFFLFNSLLVFYSGIAGELRQLLTEHNINLTWFRIIAIPGLMLSLFSPPCIKKFGSLSLVWFSTLLLTIGHALQLLALVRPGSLIYVAHAIYMAGIGFAVPSLISFIGLSVPSRIKGTTLSLYMFILFFGGGAGTFFILYTGVIKMMIAQVSVFVLLTLWLGVGLMMQRKKAISLATLAVSILPLTAVSAEKSITMEKTVMYYKELAPKEQQQYTSLWITSGKKTSGKIKTENITLYRWQRLPELALGYDNVSFQVTDKGELSGFARYLPSTTAKQALPSKEETEKIAHKFLEQYAPDLLPVMNIQWINPHRDETYTDGTTTYQINGMKMKCRSTADGTYFWVIVGSDSTVIVFERDIEWDFIRAGRQTEKWLHDDWLQKNKIPFIKN